MLAPPQKSVVLAFLLLFFFFFNLRGIAVLDRCKYKEVLKCNVSPNFSVSNANLLPKNIILILILILILIRHREKTVCALISCPQG